jgi:hypothetical protein
VTQIEDRDLNFFILMKKVRVTYSVFFFPEVSVIKLKKKRKSNTNIQTKKKTKNK